MDVQEFVSRLSGVRMSQRHSWTAICPGHADRSPSLAVKSLPDGRILIHCFAGCDTERVLRSMGLTLADLFPERRCDASPVRAAFTAIEALRALAFESGLIAILACDIAHGRRLSERDASRACVAAGRIATALEFVHG